MNLRRLVGVACLSVLLLASAATLVLIAWYLLATSPPLGIGLLVACVLMVGALWGLDP